MQPTYLIDKEEGAVAYTLEELRKMNLSGDTLVLPSDSLTWTPLQYLPEVQGAKFKEVLDKPKARERRNLLAWLKPLDFSTKTNDILVLAYFWGLLFIVSYHLLSNLSYIYFPDSGFLMTVALQVSVLIQVFLALAPLLLLLSLKDRFFKLICFLLWLRLLPDYYTDIANAWWLLTYSFKT